jgi:hypothetical protein
MPTLRENLTELRSLLEQPVQRGSAPGTAPVQTPDPAKEPKKPVKKKTRFRVTKNGEGEVTEAADAPDLPELPFTDKELDAKLTEVQKLWLTVHRDFTKALDGMKALLKPVKQGYYALDDAHRKSEEEMLSDDFYDTLHAYNAVYATIKDVIEHFERQEDKFEDLASWFEPQIAREAPTSGAPDSLKKM